MVVIPVPSSGLRISMAVLHLISSIPPKHQIAHFQNITTNSKIPSLIFQWGPLKSNEALQPNSVHFPQQLPSDGNVSGSPLGLRDGSSALQSWAGWLTAKQDNCLEMERNQVLWESTWKTHTWGETRSFSKSYVLKSEMHCLWLQKKTLWVVIKFKVESHYSIFK